jgi:hypothetical protein
MVDLVEIGMRVDSSDFVKAAADTKGFELAVAKMVQTILRENNVLKAASKASADARAEAEQRAIQKQIEAQQKLTAAKEKEVAKQQAIIDRQAKAEMDAYVKTTIAAEKAAVAKAKAAQSGIASNLGLGSTNAVGNGAGFGAMEGEIERLKVKYDSAYAASKLFEAQSKELSFAMLNQAGNADTLKNELDKLQAEYAAFSAGTTDITNRFNQQAAAVEQSRKGVNKFGLLVQQTGYQAGDFLVQLQSGTNGFVAFGQQATQLVGILPMFAAELGVSAVALGGITLGLSIAIPLITAIGAYFTRTGENAKGGSSGINAYADALKGLTEEIQKNEQAFLKAKFGTSDQNVANAKQQIKELQDQIQALSFGGGYGAGAASAIQGRNEKAANADKIAALQEQLGLLIYQENVKVGVAAAEEASRLIAMQKLDALTKQREEYLKQFGYVKDLANAEKEAANMLEGKNSVAKNLQDQAMQAKLEEFRLAKEREKTEEVAAEKAEYLRQVFHMLAGETSSISVSYTHLRAHET